MTPKSRRVRETYRSAGVDLEAADRIVEIVSERARATYGPEVLSDLSSFGSLFQLGDYQQPVLVSSTDGVGTKLKIACALDRHDNIGTDLVNHCVNDILTCGAEPLFFHDYVAMSTLRPQTVESIIRGMADACKGAGCALIGGETAEMPGLYPEGEYDLVGFIVGVVERKSIISGEAITAGDALIALPSSGLHTNGYSLVRKVFNIDEDPSCLNRYYPELGHTLGESLLEPHRCYYPMLKPLLSKLRGIAHITGGGLPGNLPRILPKGLAARLQSGSWTVPPIFPLIQEQGNIDNREMHRVFNMGIGMVLACSPSDVQELTRAVADAKAIGEVVEGQGEERVSIV